MCTREITAYTVFFPLHFSAEMPPGDIPMKSLPVGVFMPALPPPVLDTRGVSLLSC